MTHTMFFLDGADLSLSLIFLPLKSLSPPLSWSSFKTSFRSSPIQYRKQAIQLPPDLSYLDQAHLKTREDRVRECRGQFPISFSEWLFGYFLKHGLFLFKDKLCSDLKI